MALRRRVRSLTFIVPLRIQIQTTSGMRIRHSSLEGNNHSRRLSINIGISKKVDPTAGRDGKGGVRGQEESTP